MNIITEQNYKKYALKYYDNPSCSSAAEFEDDLARFRYVKRLCNKYHDAGVLKERLILNHIVVLHNLFGNLTVPILFLKINRDQWYVIKPFLSALGILPATVNCLNTNGQTSINTNEIPDNYTIINRIQQLIDD